VVAVSAGTTHTCAVTSDGAAVCWGSGDQGQLGNGDGSDQDEPVTVSGLGSGVVAVAAGARHTCAMTSGGGVLCWGDNAEGQLGYGGSADQFEPVGVSGLSSGVVAVAAGAYHTCAVTTQGAVLCWGWDNSGQLGNGIDSGSRRAPVAVSGLTSGVATVSANGAHACALTFEGAVLCWGDGRYGQLGYGEASNRTSPEAVSGLNSGVVSVSAGTRHTCAVTSGAVVKCWGDGSSGQLGSNVRESYVPLDVGTVVDTTATDAGVTTEPTGIDTRTKLDESANADASL
jgi:alpha-tubulin suppressor-like RCC1 family protein